MNEQCVAYYRVSSDQQGKSGLGLEAQQHALRDYPLMAAFTEVESGRKTNRPELEKALAVCQQTGAKLVVAKLDRLSRNMAFTSRLMESEVEFEAHDMPAASRLTIHIMAALAEEEARLISERTKAALAAAKARGTLLGSARPGHWDGKRRGPAPGTLRRQVPGDVFCQMKQLRQRGDTYASIAKTLNEQGHRTSRGNKWTRASVHRVLRTYVASGQSERPAQQSGPPEAERTSEPLSVLATGSYSRECLLVPPKAGDTLEPDTFSGSRGCSRMSSEGSLGLHLPESPGLRAASACRPSSRLSGTLAATFTHTHIVSDWKSDRREKCRYHRYVD